MAFNVNYDDLLTMQCTACNKISDWSEICSELKEAITDFINTSELQGQGMDSIRNYLSNVHYVILTTIETVATEYNIRFLLYVYGFYDFESDIHAKIDSELLSGVEEKLNNLYIETCNYYDYTSVQNNSIHDMISNTLEDIEVYTDVITFPRDEINKLRLSIEEYDYKFATIDLSNILEMVSYLKTIVGRLRAIEEVDFTSESITGIITLDEIQGLSSCIDNTYNFYTENEELITLASEHQAEVFEQIEEELAEEREKMGWIQVAQSFLGVVTTGIFCVMCPALLITGVPVITYHASNLREGCDNVCYGKLGDAYTPAYNFGRDSLLNGDQAAWDLYGAVCQGMFAVSVPVAKLYSVANYSTQGLAAQMNALKTVAVDIGKDAAEDIVVDSASMYIAQGVGMNEVEAAYFCTAMGFGSGYAAKKMSGGVNGIKTNSYSMDGYSMQPTKLLAPDTPTSVKLDADVSSPPTDFITVMPSNINTMVDDVSPVNKLDGDINMDCGNYSSLRDFMSPEEVARYDAYWNNVADDICDCGNYSSLRDFMSPEEVARYDAYWNNVAGDICEGGNYSSLRDLMSPEEVARYDAYWNNVADDMLKSNINSYRQTIINGDITKLTGGKINAKVVTAAIDMNTGDIYYGISGLNNNPTRSATNPQMQAILDSVDGTMTNYPLENCGEFNAINNALNNGVDINALRVYSVDRVVGNYKAPCINCQNLYGNIVQFIE